MSREVHVADALAWLQKAPAFEAMSVVSAIPDVSEVGISFDLWRVWFVEAAALVLSSVPSEGLGILFQTDIRLEGRWIDKSAMVGEGAARAGVELLCRKIVCGRAPGSLSSSRAAFTHLLVYGRGLRMDPQLPDIVPDVIVDPGEPTWVRGIGANAASACLTIVRRYAPRTRTILDPFCGEGMVLAVAEAQGFHAVGVERNRKRAQKARTLVAPPTPR